MPNVPVFFQPDFSLSHLTQEESHHAVRVLRMRVGDKLEVTDGQGTLASAELTSTESQNAGFRILHSTKVPARVSKIHLAIAPTKNIDRIEWMVEKVVEIGVERITFIKCAKSERRTVPIDRLNKLVVAAIKQSRQAWLTMLSDVTDFSSFIENVRDGQRFIAHVDASNPDHLMKVASPGSDCTVVVGPEGDFTNEEVVLASNNKFLKVSLGPNRLRTETAGIYAVTCLALRN